MADKFEPGELFVYTNGDRWELGMVKRQGNGYGYFCWYSRGDTAAHTPTSCMHKLSNAGFTHIEQLLDTATVGAGTCHFNVVINQDSSRRGRGNICECDKCGYRCARGFIEDERFKHCPNCGKRIANEKAE